MTEADRKQDEEGAREAPSSRQEPRVRQRPPRGAGTTDRLKRDPERQVRGESQGDS